MAQAPYEHAEYLKRFFPDARLIQNLDQPEQADGAEADPFVAVAFFEFDGLMRQLELLADGADAHLTAVAPFFTDLVAHIAAVKTQDPRIESHHIGDSYILLAEVEEDGTQSIQPILNLFIELRQKFVQKTSPFIQTLIDFRVGLHLEVINEDSQIDPNDRLAEQPLFQRVEISSNSEKYGLIYSAFRPENQNLAVLKSVVGLDATVHEQQVSTEHYPYYERMLAYVFQARRKHTQAHLLFRRAAKIFEAKGDLKELGDLYMNIGQFQENVHNFCHTKENLQLAFEYFEKATDFNGNIMASARLANSMRTLHQFEPAYQQSQALIEQDLRHIHASTRRVVWFYHAQLLNMRGNFKEGRPYLNKAYESLMEAESRLDDNGLRKFFLEEHWFNKLIITTWNQFQQTRS